MIRHGRNKLFLLNILRSSRKSDQLEVDCKIITRAGKQVAINQKRSDLKVPKRLKSQMQFACK